MGENIVLKAMSCPNCGANLKAVNTTDSIICVYCGSTVVPVKETPISMQRNAFGGMGGSIKIEGMKTPSSALAYMELFFEEYDWDAFAYSQTLSIAEIDKLVGSLKASATDDKKTWFACFNALSIPFAKKMEGCKKVLSTAVIEYKKNSFDAYSKFDAYKRIVAMILKSKDGVVEELEKILINAQKYGAVETELGWYRTYISYIGSLPEVVVYNTIEDVPEIKKYNEEKNAEIVAFLAADGINAESEYDKAKALIADEKYVEALSILKRLNGYADSNAIIKVIDKLHLIFDIIDVNGKLYYIKKVTEDNTLSIYPANGQKISNKPILEKISKIFTNYANILYFVDNNGFIRSFHLSKNSGGKIYETRVLNNKVFVYGKRVFALVEKQRHANAGVGDVIEIDLCNGKNKILIENVKTIVSLRKDKLIYKAVKKNVKTSNGVVDKEVTSIININTGDILELGTKNVDIEGFIDNGVVYTQKAPNNYNKNLYFKSFVETEPERLIEQNIFKFCDIMAGKLFYYVGNYKVQSLININCDGSGRRECPLYVSELLFEQGGWLYFIRKAGYNAILCKSRIDGSDFSVIAADIDKFIEIKNGYLYYLDDASKLMRVRMDGSNLQVLCDDVEEVLVVNDDKIVFLSVDGRVKAQVDGLEQCKIVKSIYAVDFNGGGKIKLAYNVEDAKKYNENTVYYVALEEIKSSYDVLNRNCKILYSLNIETYEYTKLLELVMEGMKNKSIISIIFAILTLLCFVISFVICGENNAESSVGFIISGIVLLILSFVFRAKKS